MSFPAFVKEELTRNAKLFAMLFAECFCAFLVLGYVGGLFAELLSTYFSVKNQPSSDSLYYLIDNTDNVKSNSGGAYQAEEWNALFHYILDNCECVMDTGLLVNIDGEFTWQSGNKASAVGVVYLTENYFDSRALSEYSGKFVPLALGSGYRKYYKTGDIIGSRFEVVCFLPEAENRINLSPDYRTSTNSAAVWTLLKYHPTGFFDRSSTDVCVYANGPAELDLIAEKAVSLGIDSVLPVSVSDRYRFMLEDAAAVLAPYFLLCAGIALAAVFCTSAGLSDYISSRRREYLIHELCGADVKKTALHFAGLTGLIIALPAAVVPAFFGSVKLVIPFAAAAVITTALSLRAPLKELLGEPLIEQYYKRRTS